MRSLGASCLLLVSLSACGSSSHSESFDFVISVLHRDSHDELVPSVHTALRVTGNGCGNVWTLETQTDSAGRAVARMDPSRGTWDVTAARAGFAPVSIVEVSGPLDTAIELEPIPPPSREATGLVLTQISGTIVGRSAPGTAVSLNQDSFWTGEDEYVTSVWAKPTSGSVHLLAFEQADAAADSAILNAAWVDATWQGAELHADIAFPDLPRTPAKTEWSLELPTTGAVTAEGLTSQKRGAPRRIADSRFGMRVGENWLEADPEVANRYAWLVEALDGDMQPSLVPTVLTNETLDRSIYATVVPGTPAAVVVPPADVLKATGTTLDTLTLTWAAPAYDHIGASLIRLDGPGEWYLHSYGAIASLGRAWPRLPSAVSPTDVGFDGTASLDVNVFAASFDDGRVPWIVRKDTAWRAVLRKFSGIGFH